MGPEERDRIVFGLYEQLLEIEQRLIPTGMHVFGRPPDSNAMADMLRMVASFDRPEAGTRSLPDLVAEGLGLPDIGLETRAPRPRKLFGGGSGWKRSYASR